MRIVEDDRPAIRERRPVRVTQSIGSLELGIADDCMGIRSDQPVGQHASALLFSGNECEVEAGDARIEARGAIPGAMIEMDQARAAHAQAAHDGRRALRKGNRVIIIETFT